MDKPKVGDILKCIGHGNKIPAFTATITKCIGREGYRLNNDGGRCRHNIPKACFIESWVVGGRKYFSY